MQKENRILSTSAIAATLKAKLCTDCVEVMDESYMHSGHYNTGKAGGVSHIKVKIASKLFEGLSRLKQHNLVNAALAEYFSLGLHAASIAVLPSKSTE